MGNIKLNKLPMPACTGTDDKAGCHIVVLATSADGTINTQCPTVNITMAGVTASAYATWSTAEATKAFAEKTDQYTMKVAAIMPATLSGAVATPAATTGGLWAYGNKLTATTGDFAAYGVKYDKNGTANDT